MTTLLHAPRTAKKLGRTFNIAVCISTWMLGIDAKDADKLFRQVRRKKFARWGSYKPKVTGIAKNGTPVDTWTWEAPEGRHHVHWMLHIQANNRKEFEVKLTKWVKAMAGIPLSEGLPDGAVYVQTVTNPEGKKLYMAKGIDPFYGKAWNIRPVDCGLVYGHRAGSSRSLGPAVWKPFKKAYMDAQR